MFFQFRYLYFTGSKGIRPLVCGILFGGHTLRIFTDYHPSFCGIAFITLQGGGGCQLAMDHGLQVQLEKWLGHVILMSDAQRRPELVKFLLRPEDGWEKSALVGRADDPCGELLPDRCPSFARSEPTDAPCSSDHPAWPGGRSSSDLPRPRARSVSDLAPEQGSACSHIIAQDLGARLTPLLAFNPRPGASLVLFAWPGLPSSTTHEKRHW